MRTDADGNITFNSSFGKLWLMFTAFMFLLCVIFFVWAYVTHTDTTLLIIGGLLFLLSGVIIIAFVRSIKYVFEEDGIRFPLTWLLWGFSLEEFIPYARITRFYETREFTGLVHGASMDKIWIEFMNSSGKKDGFALSPKNKQLFISELTKRTGLSISDKPI